MATTLSLDEYAKASAEVWTFFKSHFDGDNTDEFWLRVIDESNEIAKKYKDTELKDYVSKYLVLCVGVLNDRAKRRGNG